MSSEVKRGCSHAGCQDERTAFYWHGSGTSANYAPPTPSVWAATHPAPWAKELCRKHALEEFGMAAFS